MKELKKLTGIKRKLNKKELRLIKAAGYLCSESCDRDCVDYPKEDRACNYASQSEPEDPE